MTGELEPERRVNSEYAVLYFVYDYLLAHPCVDCGQTNILALQFDHVRGKKLGNISYLVLKHSIRIIKDEIAKCDVVCASCHQIRTHTRQGSTKHHYWMCKQRDVRKEKQ